MLRFTNPEDAARYYVGQVVTPTRPPWWVRLWRWVTRSHAAKLVVTGVDYRTGVVEIEAR